MATAAPFPENKSFGCLKCAEATTRTWRTNWFKSILISMSCLGHVSHAEFGKEINFSSLLPLYFPSPPPFPLESLLLFMNYLFVSIRHKLNNARKHDSAAR